MANIRTLKVSFFVVAMFVFGFFFFSNPVSAATITVNSNADTEIDADGNCTLREAILNANDTLDVTGGDCATNGALGIDTIVFDDAYTITLASNLPEINDPVIINGITGGHGVCSTKDLGVILNGGGHTGLTFNDGSDGSTVRGLVLKNFDGGQAAIQIEADSDNHTIACNIIGLDETGLAAAANDTGIRTYGSNIIIGGSSEGDGNVISGNTNDGISILDGSTISILGNVIGLGADGATAFDAQISGIKIDANGTTVSDVQIGDTGEFERNIISGNSFDENSNGIFLWDGTINNVTIHNNYIGTDITGLIARPNESGGIGICGTDGCPGYTTVVTNFFIGGPNEGEGNIISGNGQHGINVSDVDGLVMKGNKFGLGADGETVLPNGAEGVKVVRGSNATLGGVLDSERNIISGNDAHGVEFLGTETVVIYNNYIGTNENGTSAITNVGKGLIIDDSASDVTIGGTLSGQRNVIVGESGDDTDNTGVSINDSSDVSVVGNYIGVLADGITGSTMDGGISMINGELITISENIISNSVGVGFIGIGGTDALLEENTISNHETAGVLIFESTAFPGTPTIALVSNSMYGNGFGIDLSRDLDSDGSPEVDAVTINANDSGDGDSGPNDYLNHPEITGVDHSTETVTYNLDVPTGYYRIEFFKNPTNGLHSSGYGEGEDFVGYEIVTSAGSALTGETVVIAEGIESTDVITATATKCTTSPCTAYLVTSEFSNSETPAIPVVSNSGGGGGSVSSCKDPQAINYRRFGRHKQSLCKYTSIPITTSQDNTLGISGQCLPFQTLTQNLRAPSRNGYYNSYTGGIVKEATILQAHLNRLGFNSGPEDGIIGPITDGAIKRMQTFLGTKPDGLVGPITRGLINNSCGISKI